MGVDVVVAVDVNPARRVPHKTENLRELMTSAMDIMGRSNKSVSRCDADFLVQPAYQEAEGGLIPVADHHGALPLPRRGSMLMMLEEYLERTLSCVLHAELRGTFTAV